MNMKRLLNDKDDGKSPKERNRNLVRIPITKFRDLLSQPPPRQHRIFHCVYLGNNKFVDLNNECIEVFLNCKEKFLKDAKNYPCNVIKPFDACSFAGSVHYKRSDTDENKFDYFYIEQLTYNVSYTIDDIEKTKICLYHPLSSTVDHEIFSNAQRIKNIEEERLRNRNNGEDIGALANLFTDFKNLEITEQWKRTSYADVIFNYDDCQREGDRRDLIKLPKTIVSASFLSKFTKL